ncbi:MAG: DUF1858 domain-containing protein [Thermomicrobiales bacterium]|nr:MAG: DUF1858 domain-containing protein [Thermomicrobiales bacterium]
MFPSTVAVFLRWRMHCVGCPIARFESVSGACRAYRQPADRFLDELNRAAMSQLGQEYPNDTHFV